jgi:hypothetical protein
MAILQIVMARLERPGEQVEDCPEVIPVCRLRRRRRWLLLAALPAIPLLAFLFWGKARTIGSHNEAVRALAFSSDGRLVASGGADGALPDPMGKTLHLRDFLEDIFISV